MRLTHLIASSLLALTLAAPPTARADDCGGRSLTTVRADARAWVELRWSVADRRWEARLTPDEAPPAPSTWLPLPAPEGRDDHAHLVLVAPRSGRHFVVIDTAADHEPERRVRVYAPDRRLVLALGLGELMDATERARVTRSISHIHWLAPGEDAVALEPDGDTLRLTLASGRAVRLALGARPRLLP